MQMDLLPVPRPDWVGEFDKLLTDTWLIKKMNRKRRITEHLKYVDQYVREVKKAQPGLVIDIGPGCGELLELCRIWGHQVFGVDAYDGSGGMGNGYLRWSKLMTERQKLPVFYCGLQHWLRFEAAVHGFGKAVLINSRGSIEQCFHEYLIGAPHDEHHKAQSLNWDHEHRHGQIRRDFKMMFTMFRKLLRPGGIVLIHGNGTGSAASRVFYDTTIQSVAEACGLDLIDRQNDRLHKWRK